jgi:hypothetical protein
MMMFLVLDDLAPELRDHPIHVPIPEHVPRTEQGMKKFTLSVFRDFMKLKHFRWTHHPNNIVVDGADGFMVRHNLVFPSLST